MGNNWNQIIHLLGPIPNNDSKKKMSCDPRKKSYDPESGRRGFRRQTLLIIIIIVIIPIAMAIVIVIIIIMIVILIFDNILNVKWSFLILNMLHILPYM